MKYLLAALLLTTALTTTLSAQAGQYSYIGFKAGSFVDRCKVCLEPDGSIPSYVTIGRAYTYTNWDINIELLHRSNIDLGAPFGKSNAFEYARNGLFIEVKYKFNVR